MLSALARGARTCRPVIARGLAWSRAPPPGPPIPRSSSRWEDAMKPSPVISAPSVKPIAPVVSSLQSYSAPVRDQVQQSLTKIQGLRAKNSISAMFAEIKQLANWLQPGPLPAEVVQVMQEAQGAASSAEHISNYLWCLGRLGFQMDLPIHREIILKGVDTLLTVGQLTSRSVATSLTGLHETRCKLSDLTESKQSALMNLIQTASEGFDQRGISNALFALMKLDARWTALPVPLQTSLWARLASTAHSLSAQGASTALFALGQLGKIVTREELQVVQEVAQRAAADASDGQTMAQIAQQNAMAMLGLSKMGVKYADLEVTFRVHLEPCFLKSAQYLAHNSVASMVYAMGIMGCPWSESNPALYQALQSALLSTADSMTTQSLSQTLLGLAHADTKWNSLPANISTKLLALCALRFHPQLLSNAHSEENVAHAVYALGLMQVPWNALDKQFGSDIVHFFTRHHKQFSAQDAAQFLYGLGLMEAQFDTFSSPFANALMDSMQRVVKSHSACKLPGFAGAVAGILDSLSPFVPLVKQLDWFGVLVSMGVTVKTPRHREMVMGCVQRLLEGKAGDKTLANNLIKVGIRLSDLAADQQHAVINAILLPMPEMSLVALSDTVFQLCKLGATWLTLPADIQKNLWAHFQWKALNHTNADELANALRAMSKLGMRLDSLDGLQQKLMFDIFKAVVASALPGNVVAGLTSLQAMDASYVALPADIRDMLDAELPKKLARMTNGEVCNTMHALGAMGHHWPAITPAVKTAMQTALLDKLPSLPPAGVSKSVSALSMLKATWTELMPELSNALLRLDIPAEHNVEVLTCLLKLGVPSFSLPESFSLRSKTVESVLSMIHSMREAGQSIQVLPSDAISGLSFEGMTQKDLCTVLDDLHAMGATWSAIPHALQVNLEDAISHFMFEDYTPHLIHSLHAFGPLPEVLAPRIGLELVHHENYIAVILEGLAGKGALWTDMPKDLEQVLAKMAFKLSSHDIASILRHLSVMRASWEDLQIHTLHRIVPAFEAICPLMSSADVIACLQALGVIGVRTIDGGDKDKVALLWRTYRAVIKRFRALPGVEPVKSKYAKIFKVMDALPDDANIAVKSTSSNAKKPRSETPTLKETRADPKAATVKPVAEVLQSQAVIAEAPVESAQVAMPSSAVADGDVIPTEELFEQFLETKVKGELSAQVSKAMRNIRKRVIPADGKVTVCPLCLQRFAKIGAHNPANCKEVADIRAQVLASK